MPMEAHPEIKAVRKTKRPIRKGLLMEVGVEGDGGFNGLMGLLFSSGRGVARLGRRGGRRGGPH